MGNSNQSSSDSQISNITVEPTPTVSINIRATPGSTEIVAPTLDKNLFANKPDCTSVGDCGQLGIYGSNLTCSKKGYCQNCSVDTDCNGVDTPPGKCVNNVCSCLANDDCSCEGNDPYGCGHDKKGKCTCSKEHKGLATIKMTPEKTKSMLLILGIGLLLIVAWITYILKFSKFSQVKIKKYIMYGSGSIFLLTVIVALITEST
jgi:hypothetical protein